MPERINFCRFHRDDGALCKDNVVQCNEKNPHQDDSYFSVFRGQIEVEVDCKMFAVPKYDAIILKAVSVKMWIKLGHSVSLSIELTHALRMQLKLKKTTPQVFKIRYIEFILYKFTRSTF